MNRTLSAIAAALAALGLWAPMAPAQTVAPKPLDRSDYERVIADPGNEEVFQDFLGKLPKTTFADGEARRTYYVLEGDMLQTAQQVRAFVFAHASGSAPAAPRAGELLIMTENGIPVFWPRLDRSLTYAIDRKTFPSQQAYDLVAANFAAAAQAWVDACPTCGLSFRHEAALDDAPTLDRVTFIITFAPEETGFVAAAFFPNDPTFRRFVVVAPSYLTTGFDKVGVFRHEIGHILGYRHEQLVGVPGCLPEDNDWAPLTPYDPHSVMHYFCGGRGTLDMQLTDTDREGHRRRYQ